MVEMVQARIKELEQTVVPKEKKEKFEVSEAASSSSGSFEIINLEDATPETKPAQTQNTVASSKLAASKQSAISQPEVPTTKDSTASLEHKFRTDPDFRNQEKAYWLSLPSARNGSKPSLFSRITGIFSSSAPKVKETEKEAQIRRDWAYVTSDQGKVDVDDDVEDNDWIHVDDSEGKK